MNKTKLLILLLVTALTLNAAEGLTGDVEKLKSNTEMHIIELYAGSIYINQTNGNKFVLTPSMRVVLTDNNNSWNWSKDRTSFSTIKTGLYRYYIEAMRDSHEAGKNRGDVYIHLKHNNIKDKKLWIGKSARKSTRDSASTMGFIKLTKEIPIKIVVLTDADDSSQKLLRNIKISLEYLGEEK